MLNSRDISRLRPDVARNCRIMIDIAAADGYPILVTGTVRDREYQELCYKNGTAQSKIPTYHSVEAGLAFDICKNIKGHEYDDADFWRYCGELGKRIGFTWGGDWKGFVDKPHFQWDDHGRFTSAMILAGKYPPEMPEYEGDEELSYEKFREYMERYLSERAHMPPSAWSAEDRAWAEENGIIRGEGDGEMQYKSFCTREQMTAFLHRFSEL
ncbi:MAG: M15 family metallopeptidase [Oscillospiraceae bacterium]|nr:M15 family metallopeptidase [Oscillospiraceae bacterium]